MPTSLSDSYSTDFIATNVSNGFYFDPIDGTFVSIDVIPGHFDDVHEKENICSAGLNEQGFKDIRVLIAALVFLSAFLLVLLFVASSITLNK